MDTMSHVRHIPELVVVIFYMITETKALKNLSATSPMLWELSQRSEWASTNLAACLPIPLAKDLKFRNHHALNDLLLVVSAEDWKFFRRRAAFVRRLTVELPSRPVIGYLSLLNFDPIVFPGLRHLTISLNDNSATLLLRFLPRTLQSLHVTLDPKTSTTPSAENWQQVAENMPRLNHLVDIKIVYENIVQERMIHGPRWEPPPPRVLSIPWVSALVTRSSPELESFSLDGCVLPPTVPVALAAVSSLRTLDVTTMAHNPEFSTPPLADIIRSLNASQLETARLRDLHSARGLDLAPLAKFASLTTLNVRVDSEIAPLNIPDLSALSQLRDVSLTFPQLDQTVTRTVFELLVRGWHNLQHLSFAIPYDLREVSPPENPGYHRAQPVLHIRDLAVLGETCPSLESLSISVDTRLLSPLPFPSLLLHLKFLDFADSRLDMEDSRDVSTFCNLLFPHLCYFTPGYPDYLWRSVTCRAKERDIQSILSSLPLQ